MTTLITGGNGKTGLNLATLHHNAGKSFLIASRSGTSSNPDFKAVKFDWFDPSTFENPFKAANDIDKLYFISPPSFEPLDIAKPFLDLAIAKGVKRIVLLSASDVEKGDDFFPLGKLHQYLDEQKGIWYAALRPTWFQENLKDTHKTTILSSDTIHTACDNGLVPFISAKDIAQAAYDGLFAHENGQDSAWPRGRAPRILGPELLTNDDVATLLGSIIGRKITHVHISKGDPHPAWDTFDIPKPYQEMLEEIELRAARGQEEGYFKGNGPEGAVDKIVGKFRIRDYIESEKDEWVKKE